MQINPDQFSEQTIGSVAVAVGGTGTVYQMVTEVASTVVIFGNLALVIGGLYLMGHKIAYFHEKRKEKREEK